MNIGELARTADTKAETIRYYERIGLLPLPPRTAGNYRDYSAVHVSRLSFTRRARDLGSRRPHFDPIAGARARARRKWPVSGGSGRRFMMQ